MKFLSLEKVKTFKEIDILVEYYNSQNKIIEIEDPVYTEKLIEELLDTNSSLIRETINYRICKLVGAENFEGFCEGINMMTKDMLIIQKFATKKLIEFYQFYFEFFYQFYFTLYKNKNFKIKPLN